MQQALEFSGLSDRVEAFVEELSFGMKQRLALARALLGRPRLLILDEPTNGLDPDGIADMRSLLKNLPATEESTLLISSHLLGEVEEIATHVGLMHRGRLLVEDRLDRLLSSDGEVTLEVRDGPSATALLERAGFAVRSQQGRLTIRSGSPDIPAEPDAVARLLVENGQRLTHLARHRPSLEQVYHREIARVAA